MKRVTGSDGFRFNPGCMADAYYNRLADIEDILGCNYSTDFLRMYVEREPKEKLVVWLKRLTRSDGFRYHTECMYGTYYNCLADIEDILGRKYSIVSLCAFVEREKIMLEGTKIG